MGAGRLWARDSRATTSSHVAGVSEIVARFRMASAAVDLTFLQQEQLDSLLTPKQGYLFKLGGGQKVGTRWNKRWFILRDNVLAYFNQKVEYNALRTKPSGVVLLEDCSVRQKDSASSVEALTRPHTFVISHPSGESVLLAAESEREMLEWMQAVRTTRLSVVDDSATNMSEAQRQASAQKLLDNAASSRAEAEREVSDIEKELESLDHEASQMEVEKDRSERELKDLMARFKLRKSLLHWRHRKLTLTFRAILSVVFRERVQDAERVLTSARTNQRLMDEEVAAVAKSLKKAENAKAKAEKLFSREIDLKKAGAADMKECEKLLSAESERIERAKREEARLCTQGARSIQLDNSKEEVLQIQLMLDRCKAETELLQQQLRRRALQVTAVASRSSTK